MLAAHLRDELAAAGGRRSRRSAPGTGLTPQERRIADLASQGRTNRQIAASLSLSVNTVETHLQRVFAKLDIRSRVELVAQRHADRGDPAP
jgi:DNA-binding CsgD family transcriptional regulator